MEYTNLQNRAGDLAAFLRAQLARQGSRGRLPSPGFTTEQIIDLVVSGTIPDALFTDEAVDRWIELRRSRPTLSVSPTPLQRLSKWKVDGDTGNIVHESGRFFSITGIVVRHRRGYEELEWDQPIIDQPEVGILGILAAKIGGVLHFCLQAKEEPGNIGSVQLSPTVQATYSNYMRVHGGTRPRFVEYFTDPGLARVLFARLQTEDGGRFLFKSNRNMIVEIDEATIPELTDDFIWLTLRQIRLLVGRDNIINACTRSVLSCLL